MVTLTLISSESEKEETFAAMLQDVIFWPSRKGECWVGVKTESDVALDFQAGQDVRGPLMLALWVF